MRASNLVYDEISPGGANESGATEIVWKPSIGQAVLIGLPMPALIHRTWIWDKCPDTSLLQTCVDALVRRHQLLRTRFDIDPAHGAQARTGDPPPVPVEVTDLSQQDMQSGLQAAREIASQAIRGTRVDVVRGPLLWIRLFKLSDGTALLFMLAHHAVCDAWSCAILCAELLTLYGGAETGKRVRLPELPLEYRDHVAQQEAWLASDAAATHIAYWRNKFAAFTDPFWLPADEGADQKVPEDRPPVCGEVSRPGSIQALRDLCAQERCTLFPVVASAFLVALALFRQRSEAQAWVMHFGRNRPEAKGIVGVFADSWMLGVDLRSSTCLRDVVRRVCRAYTEAMPHIRIPPPDAMGPNPPALHPATVFNFLPSNRGMRTSSSLGARPIELTEGAARFESIFAMVVNVTEGRNALTWSAYYNIRLFYDDTIQRFSDSFASILEKLAEAPDEPFELPTGPAAPAATGDLS
jgi:hypothetical protein